MFRPSGPAGPCQDRGSNKVKHQAGICAQTYFLSAEMCRTSNRITNTREKTPSVSKCVVDEWNPPAVEQAVGPRGDGRWASLVRCPPSKTLKGSNLDPVPAYDDTLVVARQIVWWSNVKVHQALGWSPGSPHKPSPLPPCLRQPAPDQAQAKLLFLFRCRHVSRTFLFLLLLGFACSLRSFAEPSSEATAPTGVQRKPPPHRFLSPTRRACHSPHSACRLPSHVLLSRCLIVSNHRSDHRPLRIVSDHSLAFPALPCQRLLVMRIGEAQPCCLCHCHHPRHRTRPPRTTLQWTPLAQPVPLGHIRAWTRGWSRMSQTQPWNLCCPIAR